MWSHLPESNWRPTDYEVDAQLNGIGLMRSKTLFQKPVVKALFRKGILLLRPVVQQRQRAAFDAKLTIATTSLELFLSAIFDISIYTLKARFKEVGLCK